MDAGITPSAKLSLLDGGPLSRPPVTNLGQALGRAANLTNQGSICCIQEDGVAVCKSYSALLEDASRMLRKIRAAGPVPGERIAIQIACEPDFLAAFWACVLGGFVPVPVATRSMEKDPEAPTRLLLDVSRMLGQAWVIADRDLSAQAPDARAWRSRWLGTPDRLRTGTPDRVWHDSGWDDPAVLLLTSGSTGLPKAVTLTHGNILSRSAATAEVNALSAVSSSFNWMPLDHVGGLVMFHARDVFLGCNQVHARIDWILEDPLRWLTAMDRYRSGITWAPNFAFGLINDRAEELRAMTLDLSCLGYIMNGGESIKPRVVRRFLALLAPFGLPPTAMYPGWGMSETSAGVVDCRFSYADSHDDDRYVPVGRPHPGVRLRVVDERNDVLPEGTVGRLQVSGDPVTRGYDNDPEQNRQSFTADGWFKTGDLGYVKDGVLTVTGRVDDVIVLDGVGYHGHEIEAAVEEFAFVEPSYTVACEVTDPVDRVDRLAVFCHLRAVADLDEAKRRIADHIAARFGVRGVHVVPVERDDIPKTGIGKLRRAQLRRRFEAGAELAGKPS